LVLCAVAPGCGGDGGAGTSTPTALVTPAALPAPAARSAPATSILLRDGGSGQTVGDLPIQATGSRLTASLPGYLPRVAIFRGEDVYLWPQAEDYTTALIYTFADGEVYGMGRWGLRPVTVGVPDDPRTLEAVRPAIAEAASASGLALNVVAGEGDITIQVDASEFDDEWAIAFAQYMSWSGLELRKARIVFRNNNDLVGSRKALCGNTLLHELGHALGFFGHSIVGGEVMSAECDKRTDDHFSANELLALRMMYRHRRPANLVPDTEWEARGAAVARPAPSLRIECR
jgi:hypothetical protein